MTDSRKEMPMKRRICVVFLLVLCTVCFFSVPISANSAEPPCLTIVVVGAPDDLGLALVDESGAEAVQLEKLRSSRGWETYFRFFYNHEVLYRQEIGGNVRGDADVELTDLRLAVTNGGETVYLSMPASAYEHYNNVVMLDLDAMMIREDLYPGRMVPVIGLRVALTLLIEGILFWAFGYRGAYSWGVFLCVNLLTQLFLNLLIGSASMDSYVLIFYYLLEAVIIIAEAIAFPLALREKRGRSVPYAIVANLVSMFIGGLLIANLPLAL